MSRVLENGVYRDMTPKEQAQYDADRTVSAVIVAATIEQRLSAVEETVTDLESVVQTIAGV